MHQNLQSSLNFLRQLFRHRVAPFFGKTAPTPAIPIFDSKAGDAFSVFVGENRLTMDELTALATGLAAHTAPTFFDELIEEFLPKGGEFLRLGGVRGANHRGFLPTGETVFFLLGADDLARRVEVWRLFAPSHFFQKKGVLRLEEVRDGEPRASGRLIFDGDLIELFLVGKTPEPRFSLDFPAERLETPLEWADLVLPAASRAQVAEIQSWLKNGAALRDDWGADKLFKPGFRVLFHGPSGTGKTLTAALLGKREQAHEPPPPAVFRVDLSMVVSKFIGETEKNLASLFAKAEHKGWALFFDEADALFGKRTGIRDAHDKYANQEAAYLLQRVEQYDGLVILATNFKANIDDAFMRRFQAAVHFPMPGPAERQKIWENSFPKAADLGQVNLKIIAQQFEISGASILNAAHFACLRCIERGNEKDISEADVREGIARELVKEGRPIY